MARIFFFFEIGRIESISLWALSIRKREESRGYYWRWKSIGEVSRLILRMIGSQYLPGTIPFLHAIVPFHQSFTNGGGGGVSSVDTNNRALADRRRTTDCFRRHDCCHEPIKCYENTAG